MVWGRGFGGAKTGDREAVSCVVEGEEGEEDGGGAEDSGLEFVEMGVGVGVLRFRRLGGWVWDAGT